MISSGQLVDSESERDDGLISTLGRGAKAAGEQAAPGPQGHHISGGFLVSSTSCSAGMGVRAGSGGWQLLFFTPDVLVACAGMCGAGGMRTHGCPPWGIQPSDEGAGGAQEFILRLLQAVQGLEARWGAAAWLSLCWGLMNDPILNIH